MKENTIKSNPKLKKILHWVAVFILLGTLLTLSLIESSKESATFDEVVHIPAGASYVIYKNPEMNKEHPPLLKYLSGLSASYLGNIILPNYESSFSQWQFGRAVLYKTPENNADRIVFLARLPIIVLTVALAIVLYGWTRELIGANAALGCLALFCLDPNMIAFAHLVTFDLPTGFFITTSLYFLWKALTKYNSRYFIVTGLLLGLAISSKTSAVVFILPIALILLVVFLQSSKSNRKLDFFVKGLLLILLSAFCIIWLTYISIFGLTRVNILPEQFLYSLKFLFWRFYTPQVSYVVGRVTNTGNWWFLLLGILIKTTLPLLILSLIGLITLIKRYFNEQNDKIILCLALPLIIFTLIAMQSSTSPELRYIFMIYPLLYIVASFGIQNMYKKRGNIKPSSIKQVILFLMPLFYYVLALILYFPNYITFSNGLIGTPSTSYRLLAGSNSDWGQGLIQLKAYTTKYDIKQLQIVYFGEAVPDYYGFKDVTKFPQDRHSLEVLSGPLAVSVSSANYIGLVKDDYRIKNVAPVDIVANSILIYYLPP